jgi:hypothetical protein
MLTVKYGHPAYETKRRRFEVDGGEGPFDLHLSAVSVQGADEVQGGSYRMFKNVTTSRCVPGTSPASHCDAPYTGCKEYIYGGCAVRRKFFDEISTSPIIEWYMSLTPEFMVQCAMDCS